MATTKKPAAPKSAAKPAPKPAVKKAPTKKVVPKAPPRDPNQCTLQEERFAAARASGLDLTRSFYEAHPQSKASAATARRDGWAMAHRPRVAARIRELLQQYVHNTVVYGQLDALRELDEAIEDAKENGRGAVWVRAVELKMKLFGLGVAEAKNPADKDDLPHDEARALLDEVRRMRAERETLKEANGSPNTRH